MTAACTSETSISTYKTTCRHKPKDHNLNNQGRASFICNLNVYMYTRMIIKNVKRSIINNLSLFYN
jgi:hypothetical protein